VFSSSPSRVVAQYVHNYLPLTEGWIADQIRFLRTFRSLVLTVRCVADPHVDVEDVVSLADAPQPARAWNGAMRIFRGWAPLHAGASREHSVSLIHAHFGDRALQAIPLASAVGVPLVTSFYGRDMWRSEGGVDALRRRYAPLFAAGDLFLAEGPAARQRLVDIGCPPERARTHPIGVDLSRIPFIQRAVAPGQPFRLLMAARFVEKKGLEYGLRAFSAIAPKHPNVTMTVVGDAGRSSDELKVKERLLEIARDSTAPERIRFVGFVPKEQFLEIARDHHVLVQPSVTAGDGDSEGGFPVAMTELAASGMPIIATRHCDIPELVVEGETGWLADERDVDALVAAIDDALRNPELVTRLGGNARRRVEEHYDGRRTTLDEIYRSVLERT
jgi:colanic acid/amylovoran biosynthesis glycosyltransferase